MVYNQYRYDLRTLGFRVRSVRVSLRRHPGRWGWASTKIFTHSRHGSHSQLIAPGLGPGGTRSPAASTRCARRTGPWQPRSEAISIASCINQAIHAWYHSHHAAAIARSLAYLSHAHGGHRSRQLTMAGEGPVRVARGPSYMQALERCENNAKKYHLTSRGRLSALPAYDLIDRQPCSTVCRQHRRLRLPNDEHPQTSIAQVWVQTEVTWALRRIRIVRIPR